MLGRGETLCNISSCNTQIVPVCSSLSRKSILSGDRADTLHLVAPSVPIKVQGLAPQDDLLLWVCHTKEGKYV